MTIFHHIVLTLVTPRNVLETKIAVVAGKLQFESIDRVL
jgi:hypothetical protein